MVLCMCAMRETTESKCSSVRIGVKCWPRLAAKFHFYCFSFLLFKFVFLNTYEMCVCICKLSPGLVTFMK